MEQNIDYSDLKAKYNSLKKAKKELDLTRGRPSSQQLDFFIFLVEFRLFLDFCHFCGRYITLRFIYSSYCIYYIYINC